MSIQSTDRFPRRNASGTWDGDVSLEELADAVAPFLAEAGGGGLRTLAFPFAFDTPDLVTGAEVYTPTIGDILHDAWVEILEPWDGTTPTCDFGLYNEEDSNGWFGALFAPVDLTLEPSSILSLATGNGQMTLAQRNAVTNVINMLLTGTGENPIGLTVQGDPPFFVQGNRYLPARFAAADPVRVLVSTDGTNDGDDPGGTVGSAILYLVVSTPEIA